MNTLNVHVRYNNAEKQMIPYDHFTFSGGEEHIRFDFTHTPAEDARLIFINARLTNSQSILLLALAVDALREHFPNVRLELSCAYFPYARQDRVCYPGEAYSLSVMATLINSMCFDAVYVTDPHSPAVKRWVHNCVVMPQHALFVLHHQSQLNTVTTVVSPDKGATEKAKAVQETLGIPYLIQAEKTRDRNTGQITELTFQGDIADHHVLIPDDICDGGGTFINLGQQLKQLGARRITLFVTHGIFSKGFEPFEGILDSIITTNSFRTKAEYEQLNTSSVALTIMELQGL